MFQKRCRDSVVFEIVTYQCIDQYSIPVYSKNIFSEILTVNCWSHTFSSGCVVNCSTTLIHSPKQLLFMLSTKHWRRWFVSDGINCLTSRFVESYMSCPDTSNGMITSVLQHLTPWYSLRRPPTSTTTAAQLMMSGSDNESLMNFAPLGESCYCVL